MNDNNAPGRMIGLDVGERRIGVAVSEGRIAVPLTIIEHRNRAADIARIVQIARDRAAEKIVIGLPLMTISGDEGEQARLTRRFGDQLAMESALPVVYQDERYSTATAAIAPPPRTKRGAKPRLDDRAAAVILQSYIDAMVDA